MKLKNLVFTFFVLNFLSNNSFCMQEKLDLEKDSTLGAGHFRSLVGCLKSEELTVKEKELIVDTTMDNAIRYAFFKAKRSLNGISSKLNDIPYVGGVLSTATDGIAYSIFDCDLAIKESNNIKNKAKVVLKNNINNLSDKFYLDDADKKSLRWFHEVINISEKEKTVEVEYLNSKFTKFEDFEKENAQVCFDILCFITDFAKKNKDFFISTIGDGFNKKTKNVLSFFCIYNKLCGWFHTKLSDPKSNIEAEIRSNLYPEESKGKELVLKK